MPAHAQGEDEESVQAVLILSGECTSLELAGRAAPGCVGTLTNSTYSTGRSSFMFLAGDVALVSFSGMSGDDLRQGDSIVQPLDLVTFRVLGAGINAMPTKAIGTCRHTNPFAGVATINCTAETKAGRFSATFRTDGEPPTVHEYD
jgi:hypothetical protein